MYGIIAEADSDAATLKVLVRRLANNDTTLRIRAKGYDGCGEMFRKAPSLIGLFLRMGLTRFVIAYDADGADPLARRQEVMSKIVRPSGVQDSCCVVIPVEEIEAWILADIGAVSHVFSSWHPAPIRDNPETIHDPKEYLEDLSRKRNKKPIYAHATHNERVAEYLRLDVVAKRCPSFVPLAEFVSG